MGLLITGANFNTNNYTSKMNKLNSTNPLEFKSENTAPIDVFEKEKVDTKKILKTAGIIGSVIAVGVLTSVLTRKLSVNVSALPKECQKFADFKNFKKLRMCKNLSEDEITMAYNYIKKDLGTFATTLNGNKPMALVAMATDADIIDTPFEVLKKLDLGDNFEVIKHSNHMMCNGKRAHNTFILNKQKLFETFENHRDFYTSRLSLPETATKEEIYEALTSLMRTKQGSDFPNDLLGASLGFPKHDAMIFHLEGIGNINYMKRETAEFSDEILKVFKSDESPFKNLSKEALKDFEEAIKRIKYNYNDHHTGFSDNITEKYYQFVHFTEDPAEYQRILNDVKNFEKTFKFSDWT